MGGLCLCEKNISRGIVRPVSGCSTSIRRLYYGKKDKSNKIFPTTLVTAVFSKPEPVGGEGAFLWMENNYNSKFGICFKEAKVFSGLHSGLTADVLTFNPRENLMNASESGQVKFRKEDFYLIKISNPLCKAIRFSKRYHRGSRPTVLLSPKMIDQFEEDKEVVVVA
eukprot:m.170593 g.170593  ORF g.170593 m.170593 type:complete len:167 (+) comp39044_c0_seq9:399-899(+)